MALSDKKDEVQLSKIALIFLFWMGITAIVIAVDMTTGAHGKIAGLAGIAIFCGWALFLVALLIVGYFYKKKTGKPIL